MARGDAQPLRNIISSSEACGLRADERHAPTVPHVERKYPGLALGSPTPTASATKHAPTAGGL
eukprot:5094782-Lingulodinium_polyedra.AAC.1